ncbi:MAG TPA: hypothetical protein VM073_07225 [Usitatibacter sp.]|nr:hypothetical protein [Usitatibacter sp.]
MRIKPIHLAAAVALALSGSTVFAQTSGGALRIVPGTSTSANTTGTSTNTGTSTTAAQAGGCSGSGGSSCSTGNNSGTNTTGTTGVSGATPGSTTAGVTSDTNNFGQSLRETPSGSGSGSGNAFGTNQTSVDPATTRPGSFAPGGAFGPTGTTSTTTGGVGAGTGVGVNNGTNGIGVLPGTTTGFVAADGTTMPQTANQQNVVIQQPQQQASARVATPIFDEVAREGRAKERARRAQGNEPRIIGIAPRTDVDRTHQMPDDPIIRY